MLDGEWVKIEWYSNSARGHPFYRQVPIVGYCYGMESSGQEQWIIYTFMYTCYYHWLVSVIQVGYEQYIYCNFISWAEASSHRLHRLHACPSLVEVLVMICKNHHKVLLFFSIPNLWWISLIDFSELVLFFQGSSQGTCDDFHHKFVLIFLMVFTNKNTSKNPINLWRLSSKTCCDISNDFY